MAPNHDAPPILPTVNRDGDERSMLTEMLDYYRAVLHRKAAGLDLAALGATIEPSELSLGGLMIHMALVEDNWFSNRLIGEDPQEPWASVDWDTDPDWDFHSPDGWNPDRIFAQYQTSTDRSRRILAGVDSLDQKSALPARNDVHPNVRWILVHMIEEYARHCGHADLLRQRVDGATGD